MPDIKVEVPHFKSGRDVCLTLGFFLGLLYMWAAAHELGWTDKLKPRLSAVPVAEAAQKNQEKK